MQISERFYQEPSMVIDAAGNAHVAARLGRDVYYVTNASGSWTRERISRATAQEPGGLPELEEIHGTPLIAQDVDGSLGVAFTPRCRECAGGYPDGVYFTTNRDGRWSDATQVSSGWATALRLDNGDIHLAYNNDQVQEWEDLNDLSHPLYGTDAGGSWSEIELANIGDTLDLWVGPHGAVRVLIVTWAHGASDAARIGWVSIAGAEVSAFDFSPIMAGAWSAAGAFHSAGEAHAFGLVEGQFVYSRRTERGWSEPVPALGESFAIGSAGEVHTVWGGWDDEEAELHYATNRTGQFASSMLGCCAQYSTIAIGPDGRAHIFYSWREGTFYAVTPGR